MLSWDNNMEFKKVTCVSLITYIYLPSIFTVISYMDLLYSLGKRSSFFVLLIIFIAELMKVLYLKNSVAPVIALKKTKRVRSKASDILRSFIFLLCATLVYFIGIILFGAPVLDKHEETLILSVLMMLLTTFPLVAYVGVETSLQLLLGVKDYNRGTVLEMYVNNALYVVCGGWVGAVVIPLDWNMPWQEWPIPCYLGVIAGYLLSNFLTILKAVMLSAANKYPALNAIMNFVYTHPILK